MTDTQVSGEAATVEPTEVVQWRDELARASAGLTGDNFIVARNAVSDPPGLGARWPNLRKMLFNQRT